MKAILLKISIIAILFLLGDHLLFSLLKKGMDRYYGMDKDAQILLVGHSHTVLGLDAARLESELEIPVAKYATAGANILDRYWMLRHFVGQHPGVKTVVYDVDPRLFDSEGLSSASYTLFLPYIDNQAMAEYLKEEASWQEYYAGKLLKTSRFRDQSINIALRGVLGKVENSKSSQIRIENYTNYFEREKEKKIRIDPESVQCFLETMEYLSENGIEVFLVFIPVIDLLNNIDPLNQKKVMEIFEGVATEKGNVHFLDYNGKYQHNHDLFYDLRHLNYIGNRVVTSDLVDDIQRLTGHFGK